MTCEESRLQGAQQGVPWRKWGPYLSERQWGTVGEDYSQDRNAWKISHELANRLIKTFTRDATGRRPVYGCTDKSQSDPHWGDHILFYEFFHGDNGVGIGASHQTGWTGTVANLIQFFGRFKAEDNLATGLMQAGSSEDSGVLVNAAALLNIGEAVKSVSLSEPG